MTWVFPSADALTKVPRPRFISSRGLIEHRESWRVFLGVSSGWAEEEDDENTVPADRTRRPGSVRGCGWVGLVASRPATLISNNVTCSTLDFSTPQFSGSYFRLEHHHIRSLEPSNSDTPIRMASLTRGRRTHGPWALISHRLARVGKASCLPHSYK